MPAIIDGQEISVIIIGYSSTINKLHRGAVCELLKWLPCDQYLVRRCDTYQELVLRIEEFRPA